MSYECCLKEGTSALNVRLQDLFGAVHEEQSPQFQFPVEKNADDSLNDDSLQPTDTILQAPSGLRLRLQVPLRTEFTQKETPRQRQGSGKLFWECWLISTPRVFSPHI